MDDFCHDFEALHDTWTRTAEVGAAVYGVDSTVQHSGQRFPLRLTFKDPDVLQGSFCIVAAACEYEYFRTCFDYLLPGNPDRRQAFAAERVDTARNLHQFRRPVPAAEQRIYPLKMAAARPPCRLDRSSSNAVDPLCQRRDQRFSPIDFSQRGCNALNVTEDLGK